MAHQYTGFSVSNRSTVHDCATEAAQALDKAHKAVISLARNAAGKNLKDYERWFGTFSRPNLTRVTEVVALMDYALNSGRIHFTYNEGCGATTNAAAFQPTHGWKTSKLKETLSGGTFKITMCPRFFGAMSQSSVTEQSRTETFIHELSHIVGNTEDEVHPDWNATAYGRNLARDLADNHPNLAVSNAENYGFYCMWINQDLTQPDDDMAGAFAQLFG